MTGTCEAVRYKDPVTGVPVLQLTSHPELRSVHGYYDLPPWSRTSFDVVFSRLAPLASEGDICVASRTGENLCVVAHSRFMTSNDGAKAQWSADGTRVFYDDRDEDGNLCLSWTYVENGESGSVPGAIRMVCPTGDKGTYFDDYHLQPDEHVRLNYAERGARIIDFATGKSHQVVSIQDCLDIHPRRDEIDGWHLYIKHTKWSPDGQRLMFVFTNEIFYADKYNELPRVKDIYVINADGTGLKRVGEFGHHPLWHPNCHQILANAEFPGRPKLSMVLYDTETGERSLATKALGGMGHPSYSPDGRWIAADYVLAGEGGASLLVVDTLTDTAYDVLHMGVLNHSHTGTHLHPAWSWDGQELLVASDASGRAQLVVVNIDDMMRAKGIK